jgi:hypothetical protein
MNFEDAKNPEESDFHSDDMDEGLETNKINEPPKKNVPKKSSINCNY